MSVPQDDRVAGNAPSAAPFPTGCTGCNPTTLHLRCPVHGEHFAAGLRAVSNNVIGEYDMTGYEDGDPEYLLVFSKKGVEISRRRVVNYKLWTVLAHMQDTIDYYEQRHPEPAPFTAADSLNASGVEPSARGDLREERANENSGPETDVDVSVSRAPSVSGHEWVILHRGECRCVSHKLDAFHSDAHCDICGHALGFDVPIATARHREAFSYRNVRLYAHLSCVLAEEESIAPSFSRYEIFDQPGANADAPAGSGTQPPPEAQCARQRCARPGCGRPKEFDTHACLYRHDPVADCHPFVPPPSPSAPSSPSSSPTGTPEPGVDGSGVPPAGERGGNATDWQAEASRAWGRATSLESTNAMMSGRIASLESQVTELQADLAQERQRRQIAQDDDDDTMARFEVHLRALEHLIKAARS